MPKELKWLLATFLLFIAAFVAMIPMLPTLIARDRANMEKHCASVGGPRVLKLSRGALCLTGDGRVMGSW